MRRIAALTAAGLLAVSAVLGTASPAQAQSYYPVGCPADGTRIVSTYPAFGGQDVYTCRFSPYYNYWEYSWTCEDGTTPVPTLEGPYYTDWGQELYISHTSCVAN